MAFYICNTCGSQFSETMAPPPACPICDDERQYVPTSGQTWTTHDSMTRKFTNTFRQYEPNLMGIGTVPAFGIAQRALLIRTPEGNVLWDCVSLIDEATLENCQSSRRLNRNRYFTSPLLQCNGRMESRIWRSANSPAGSGSAVDHAQRSCDQFVGRRYASDYARHHVNPLWRSFFWRIGLALVSGRGRARLPIDRRRDNGDE